MAKPGGRRISFERQPGFALAPPPGNRRGRLRSPAPCDEDDSGLSSGGTSFARRPAPVVPRSRASGLRLVRLYESDSRARRRHPGAPGPHHRGAGRDRSSRRRACCPSRVRSASAYEQKSAGLRAGHPPAPAQPEGLRRRRSASIEIAQAIAADAKLPHVRIDTLSLNADLIESKMSRPFAKRHRMIPLEMANGRLRRRLRQPLRHRGHRLLPAHRRPRPRARGRLRARHPARRSPSSTACATRSSAPSAT